MEIGTSIRNKHYSCTSCNEYEGVFGVYDKIPSCCPICGGKSCLIKYIREEEVRERESCHVDALMKENFRWSDSMGCTERDLPRMKKLHPDSVWRKRPSGGYQMGIRNRHEKLRRMKEAGMQELD